MLPQLRQLERKYADSLAVIGVHSAKFNAEQATEAIKQALLRYGVEHPVINDKDFQVWQSYAVRAWPTLMFLTPDGKVLAKHEGEVPLSALDRVVGQMIDDFDRRGLIDRRPLDYLRREPLPARGLAFPGKLLADEASGRLFVSDSGHNRVVEADLEGGVLRVFGGGEAALRDGPAEAAAFNAPQGLALAEGRLLVADAGNHAVRVLDLETGRVETLAGTGEQATGRLSGGPAREIALNSPYDLALVGDQIFAAMAGFHQIWVVDLARGTARPFAGSGREALTDGPPAQADFSQPLGLATDGRRLWSADSEASAVREIDLASGEVKTLVGLGLFVFGDEDGVGEDVRLQHVEGLAWHRDTLWLADTYNHSIKRLDPASRAVSRVAGRPEPGHRDGPAAEARFDEPSGLSGLGERLFVADTNNHAVRVLDLATAEVHTLELRGLD